MTSASQSRTIRIEWPPAKLFSICQRCLSDRQPPQREHPIAVLCEVTSAGVAAEVQGLAVHVCSRARVLDPEHGAAHGAVDPLTELRARLRDGLGIAAA